MQRKIINFVKMSGSGNDFIVIDNRNKIVRIASAFAKKYCNKEGVDGLLLVEKALQKQNDFKMVYYNSDGSRASFCGNGARCISLFAYLNKIAPSKMSFESDSGIILAEIKNCSRKAKLCYDVKVKMPTPRNFKPDFNISVFGKNLKASFINTGVPHTVIFVKDIKNVDVNKLGRLIRFHKKFKPEGTNVNFVKVLAKNKLRVRTYERGVEAETLACGTGVVASSVISIMKKYVSSPVSVLTQGGETLKVHCKNVVRPFTGCFPDVFLEGKVTIGI